MTSDGQEFEMTPEWKPRFLNQNEEIKINNQLKTSCIVQLVFLVRRLLHPKHHPTQTLRFIYRCVCKT